MISLLYKVGTATVSNGSTTVTGTDTGWLTAKVAGGLFVCLGRAEVIESVESETSLTLAQPWSGPNFTGGYSIGRAGSEASDSVFAYQTLTEVLRRAFLAPVQPNGIGTLTQRDNVDAQQLFEGYIWLRWEEGEPLELYFFTGEDWDGPYEIKGDDGATINVTALDDLSDVSITTPQTGDILRYDGAWINHDASGWHPVSVTSNTATIDIDDGDKFIVTVDDDCEIVLDNAVDGAPFAIRIVIDGGTHSVTFGSEFVGEVPEVLSGEGDETVVSGIILDAGMSPRAIVNLVKQIPASS